MSDHIHICIYQIDSYLQGGSYKSYWKNVNDKIIMLQLLNFTINSKLKYLGFIINSKDMGLKLTEKQIKKFTTLIPDFLKNRNSQYNL